LRVPPACPAYGSCGGCRLEHVAYPAQLGWKRAWVAAVLDPLGIATEPCVPSPRALAYRNRSKLVYGLVDGRPVLGAYAPRSHALVDLAGCRVAEAPLDEVAGVLTELLAARAVPPYDEHTGAGALRYVILRVNHRRQVLAVLVTAVREAPFAPELARALVARRPDVVGVVQNLNPARGNRLTGETDLPLVGAMALEERVGEVRLRLSPTAFFQVNREVAAQLYADLRDLVAPSAHERVVDCYSGVGGVALTLAAWAGEVIGIEENAAAVEDARASAVLNGTAHARFVAGDAAEQLGQIEHADVIVLNPPRKGCAPSVLEAAVRAEPRAIAYVSCAPETLARDLAQLAAAGYRTRQARPYDMLPQTPHVEVLAVVTRDGRAR
jgi:23S rRNA (uracil1939-C5)-methyltransferase